MIFGTLPDSVTKTLNIVSPRRPLVRVPGLDQDGNVVRGPDLQTVLTLSKRNGLLLFSVAGWPEPKQSLKQYRFEKTDTIYVQITLMKKKAVRFPLATEVGTGAHDRKAKYVVENGGPASCSTIERELEDLKESTLLSNGTLVVHSRRCLQIFGGVAQALCRRKADW